MRPCFTFKAKANDDKTTVLAIDDEIGFWGVQASDFRASLNAVKTPRIQVSINSPGGDVFAGLAIYNMLRGAAKAGKDIETEVVGVAASAASLILMAGDKRTAPKNTFVMVHNPWGVAIGNADEMRDTADVLDKIGASLQSTYVERTGQPENAISAMLAVDTWMTADEALASGFVTEVTDAVQANASFDMDKADLPEHIRAIYAAAKPAPAAKTPEEIQAAADELAERERIAAEAALAAQTPVATAVHALAIKAGLTDHADYLAVAASTVEDGEARVKRAGEIVALAKFAKRPDSEVKALVRGTKTVAEARTEIMTSMASEDVHTSTIKPVTQPTMAGAKSPTDVYAARAAAKLARKAKTTR
jgi:ATP-dependent Clp protease protease subunit